MIVRPTSLPKIFLFGACDLHDIVDNTMMNDKFDVVYESPYGKTSKLRDQELDFNNTTFPVAGTSIVSLYTNPGNIAKCVTETMHLKKNKNYNDTLVYKEVAKFPYLNFYKKHAGPNDYIIINFSAEIYTKILAGQECFTCLPAMKKIAHPANKFYWLYKDYIQNDLYHLPFDTKESLELSFDMLVDFARDIYDIFQDRVILVKTHFADFVISNDQSVTKVIEDPSDIFLYKQSKIVTDPTDHKYAERLSMLILNKFKHHYKSDIPVVKLDEYVFLDTHHRWGVGQFHLDQNSRNKICKKIYEELVKKIVANEAIT
jgi:hypothetical protein